MRFTTNCLIIILLSCIHNLCYGQIEKEELEKRIKSYYVIQSQDYASTEAHIQALEPYIIPTREGKIYAHYVANSWYYFKNKHSDFTISTRIIRISPGPTNNTGIVITEDFYDFGSEPDYTVYSESEWIYHKKNWYRGAKRSIQHRKD